MSRPSQHQKGLHQGARRTGGPVSGRILRADPCMQPTGSRSLNTCANTHNCVRGGLHCRPAAVGLAAMVHKGCWQLSQPCSSASALHRMLASGMAVIGCSAVLGGRQQQSVTAAACAGSCKGSSPSKCHPDHLLSCASFHGAASHGLCICSGMEANNACGALLHPVST